MTYETDAKGWFKILGIFNHLIARGHHDLGLCAVIDKTFTETGSYFTNHEAARPYHAELAGLFRPIQGANAWWMGTDDFRRRALKLLIQRHNPIFTRAYRDRYPRTCDPNSQVA